MTMTHDDMTTMTTMMVITTQVRTYVRIRKVTAPLLAKRLETKMNDALHGYEI